MTAAKQSELGISRDDALGILDALIADADIEGSVELRLKGLQALRDAIRHGILKPVQPTEATK
ncbi:MAG: hypothetical protein A2Z99_11320 [Treponema sp. GWB1_62_6]|nr:MAG: hypothetical protein A2Z99_11320 [Treponema sp. GWB1_62_6]OHE68762.1 MAG: hypothetical protein A2001_13925 [Treponema sp. GWC1_61_84]